VTERSMTERSEGTNVTVPATSESHRLLKVRRVTPVTERSEGTNVTVPATSESHRRLKVRR
jgi:hypothetical protein